MMNSESSRRCLFVSAASFILFATYAADSFSNGESDDSFRLDISNRVSVFGELDWQVNDVPDKYAEAMLSVGTVLRTGPDPGAAVGTLIHDSDNRKHYVLTAKHAIYNPETKMKRPGNIYLGFESSRESYVVDTKNINEELPEGGDYVLVQVLDAPNTRGISVSDISNTAMESSSDAVMLSVLLYKRNVYRIVQNNVQLSSFLWSLGWLSDVDAVVGMSGSPVFVETEGRLKIVGILTSVTQTKCEKLRPFCLNKVTRVKRL